MAIPTIPGTARIQDQTIGVQRNAQPRIQALGAFKQAAGAASDSISSMAGDVVDYEEKKRKAEEAYAFNSSSLSFQKLHSEYLHGVKKMPDEQIVPNWSETTANWKQQQLDTYGGKLSPRAKKVFEMNLNNAIGESTAKFQVVADKLGSQRREGAAVANWGEFLKTGDPAMAGKAMASLKMAQAAGDITPDKVAFYQSQVKPVLQKNQILNGIDSDPYATLKSIDAGKFKDVPETELATLRNTAEKQVNFVQRTKASDLVNDFQMTQQPKTDKELSDLKAAGKITGTYAENYKKMVAREDYKDAENKQAISLMQLHDLDLSNSDNPEKDVRKITDDSASLPPQLQKAIHTLADSKLKAAKKGQEHLSPDLVAHERLSGMLKNGFFGNADNKKTEAAAYSVYGKAMDDFAKWHALNPKANNEAQIKEIDSLTAPHVQEAVKSHFWDSVAKAYQLPPMQDFGAPRGGVETPGKANSKPDIDSLLKKYGGQ